MKILRLWHERYAKTMGYFWLPCPVCGEYFGGHEWKGSNTIYGPQGSFPRTGYGVCSSRCANDPKAGEAWQRQQAASK